MVSSFRLDLNLVTNIPAAEKARSASTEVGGGEHKCILCTFYSIITDGWTDKQTKPPIQELQVLKARQFVSFIQIQGQGQTNHLYLQSDVKRYQLQKIKKRHCRTSDAGSLLLRTGGQGHRHPTPIHTPTPIPHSNIRKKYRKRSFFYFSTRSSRTNGPTDGPTDGRTKPLIELRVRN